MALSDNRFPTLANIAECTGCMACVAICPKKAIKQVENKEGHFAVELDKERCVKCLKCENVCYRSKENYGSNNPLESQVYCGWAQNSLLRKEGTSGGIFAAVAEVIIKENGIVFGAAFDGHRCFHISIDCIDDIIKLQKSKYVQSLITDVYEQIENALPHRKVLFSGTGCQVGAVIEYFKNNKHADNLFTLDIICGGVPSNVLIKKYLDNDSNIDSVVAFRNKDKYELTIQKKGCTIPVGEKTLPLYGYACGMTNRYCCYNCRFAYMHRKSDITIGDLWNYQAYPDEHKNGISTVIVHSLKGKNLLNCAAVTLHALKWEDVTYTNKRILYGKEHIYLPRRILARNIRKMSYLRFERLYCLKMKPWNVLEYLFKIYHFFVCRCDSHIAQKQIKKIMSQR